MSRATATSGARLGRDTVDLAALTADAGDEAWREVAGFLSSGFGRAFSPAALRWEFRRGFLLTARRAGALVGTQGFIPFLVRVGDRPTPSAKSERTLLAPSERGAGLFERLYDRAVELAVERLGAELLWGVTAVPQAFEKIGYSTFSNVYTHTLLPLGRGGPGDRWVPGALATALATALRPWIGVRWGRGTLLSRKTLPTDAAVRPVLDPATLAWCAEYPDGSALVHDDGVGHVAFTIDGAGLARLRFLEGASVAHLGRLLAGSLPRLHAAGTRAVRLSWNAESPTGRALSSLLCRTPYPFRRGRGHFIVRPLAFRDRRLCGHREAWELMGWEDLIHQPPAVPLRERING